MPIVDNVLGVVTPRRLGEPLAITVSAATDEFGFGVRNPANTIREIVEAVGAMPWDEREQDMVNLAFQFDPRVNIGQFLEAALWPLFKPKVAAASAGKVQLNYKSILTTPTPLFAAGDLEFFDGAGLRYTGSGNINPPGTILDLSGQTGTASETIGSANTKIAQKVRILDTEFPQMLRILQAAIVSGTPSVAVRIETDSAGSPSGVLANSRLTKSGVTLVGAGNTDVIFTKGAKLDTGDYWIVITVTSGTATFDGGTGGTLNQAMFYNGAWTVCATVENLDVKLYNGGQFPVVSAELGKAGNIDPGSIGSYRANSGAAQTLFDTNVASFENLEVFKGGRDTEDSEQLRARARTEQSARGTTSPGGIVHGMLDGTVPGVTFVDILENDSLTWGAQETVLNNSTKTGTNSDLIDGATYYKIAQSFVVSKHASASQIALKLGADTASTMTVGIYADSAGSPGAALYSAKLEKTGVTPGGTTRYAFAFANGDYLEAGTYWLVLTRTAGSFRVDGTNTGATNNVKRYTGSAWQASTVVKDINVEIYGGVPPKSFELFVDGTASDDEVAQGIYGLKAPGITAYGPETGTYIDAANRSGTLHFAHPVNVPIVVSIEVQVTPAFAGAADDIRNLVSEYVAELGIGKTMVRTEAMGRLITGDARTIGVFDVVTFRLGRKASFATPAALTGTEIVNLTNPFGNRFVVSNLASDIAVVLTPVAG